MGLGSIENPIRILLVEDNPADVYLIREALVSFGLPVALEHVRDGEEAVRQLRAGETFSLMILDLNLPKVDGLEVLSLIASLPQRPPVVVLSSSQSPEDRHRVGQYARTCFLTKPMELENYLALGMQIRRFWDGFFR